MKHIRNIILNELKNEPEMLEFVGSLPAFPHGKGTDIEKGIFVKAENLDEILLKELVYFIKTKNLDHKLSEQTKNLIKEF